MTSLIVKMKNAFKSTNFHSSPGSIRKTKRAEPKFTDKFGALDANAGEVFKSGRKLRSRTSEIG